MVRRIPRKVRNARADYWGVCLVGARLSQLIWLLLLLYMAVAAGERARGGREERA